MFKELQPLAEKSPLAMMISAEGDQLRVVITQKKAGAAGTPLSLSILGTPEELDTDLPASIAAASGVLAKPAPVAEQVKTQVDTALASAKPPRKSTPSPKAAKPKPVKKHAAAKPPKVNKIIRVKPAAPKHAAPAAGKKPSKLRASRPNGDACVADYHVLHAKHGDRLTREMFMKEADTGRRFERVFGNWNKFVAAALAKGTQGPPGDDKTKPLELELPGTTSASEAKALATATLRTLPDTWPFPTTSKDVELSESKEHTGDGWDVYDRDGNYLSSITTHPEVGKTIQLAGRFPAEEVVSIDGRRVITKPAATAPHSEVQAGAVQKPDGRREEAAGPAVEGRTIVDRSGRPLAGGVVMQAEEGKKIDVPGHGKYKVVDYDKEKIIVEPVSAEKTT